MHWVNKLLLPFHVQIVRGQEHTGLLDRPRNRIPREFIEEYNNRLQQLQGTREGFLVLKDFYYEAGDHPHNDETVQCMFAASMLYKYQPKTILDIGSYRNFVIGLLAHSHVISLDVRVRPPEADNETVLTCDAKAISLPDNSLDTVVSLCALEHFGLGRYGDSFDLTADSQAMREMIRVLKPGGHLIFTTQVTPGQPAIAFNAHRIYSHDMIKKFCSGTDCVTEKFYDREQRQYRALEELPSEPGFYSIYCGCWQKS